MSKAQRRVGKYVLMIALSSGQVLSKSLSSEKLLQRPVELDDGKRKPLAFVYWSKGFSCVKDIRVLNTTSSLS